MSKVEFRSHDNLRYLLVSLSGRPTPSRLTLKPLIYTHILPRPRRNSRFLEFSRLRLHHTLSGFVITTVVDRKLPFYITRRKPKIVRHARTVCTSTIYDT